MGAKEKCPLKFRISIYSRGSNHQVVMTEQNHIACKHGQTRTFTPPRLAPSRKFLKFGVSTLSEMAFSSAHFSIYNSITRTCIFSFYKDTKCVKNTLFCVNFVFDRNIYSCLFVRIWTTFCFSER